MCCLLASQEERVATIPSRDAEYKETDEHISERFVSKAGLNRPVKSCLGFECITQFKKPIRSEGPPWRVG
jgi:hypothetical protein